MQPRYTRPPYQPKWILRLQVFLLHRLKSSKFMVITTTGRKTGRQRSVPIDYIADGDTYLVFNMGGHSNWYRNALANPQVTLELGGRKIRACAEPVPATTPQQLKQVLDAYSRERPGLFEGLYSYSAATPVDELMDIGKYSMFMRFRPQA